MKRFINTVSIILSLVLLVGLFSACGGAKVSKPSQEEPSQATENTTTEKKATEEIEESDPQELIEVSVAIWNAEEGLSGGEEDAVKAMIEQKTGVRLVPQNITWDDAEQKIQLWATNGQLPDIFVGDYVGKSFFFNWIEQGVVRALPDDLSSYPNLQAALSTERASAAKQNDKYYMIPRQTYPDISYSVQDRNIVYRWDLAQAAGVTQEPTTYDEFREMILKITQADPEGKAISGMTQALPSLISGFIYPYGGILEKKWVAKDGQFMPSYFSEDLVPVMQLARDMYQEGTIEQDIALAKLDTSKEKFLQGQNAAMVFAGSGPAWLYSQLGKDYNELYADRDFLTDIRIAKLFPGMDGNKYYFVDTEAWSETYISSAVDDDKVQGICKLFDFLHSEEGKRLVFCGIEGEDYDIVDGNIQRKGEVDLGEKYAFTSVNSNINSLAMWNPADWDASFPSINPPEYRALNTARHQDAVDNGTLPSYYDAVLFLSTPLKDTFVFNPDDDLLQIMLGSEPVEDMVSELMASYEAKGLSKMLEEVNKVAKEQGITP